jgi:hypothetical protein
MRTSSLLGKITVSFVICCCCLPAHAKYGGGSGTQNDPYLIYDANQMNAIGADQNDWDKHFKLKADIDLSSFTGTSFNIIGEYVGWSDPANKPFTGVFDGTSHKISNFTYSLTGKSYIGLFSLVAGTNAVIKDLCLINPNVNVQSGGGAASLVGHMQDGTIINCYVKGGSITAETWVGGLVGLNLQGTVTNCYAETSVSGVEVIGGLVAGNWNALGTIYNSYSEGTVSGNSRVGGLLGHNSGKITNCYATGSVAGTTGVGGLVRYHEGGSYIKSFWDNTVNPGLTGIGNTTSPDVTGQSTTNMQTESTFTSAGWDFVGETANGTEDIWKIRQGQDYPRLSWEKYGGGTGEPNDPYLIFNANQMNAIGADSNDWDEHFKLMADIDLSAFTGTAFNIIGYHVAFGDPDDKPFNGVFDGNGHTISNFTYSSTGINLVGIFSYAWDAEIKNLGLINPNVNVEAGDGVGPLAGAVEGTVSNCYARGGSVTGDFVVGGLLGAHFGHISESFADVNVYGQTSVGGLIGTIGLAPIFAPITVENCYALGSVDGNDNVGGLVGELGDGVICNSYSAGHVSGTGNFVGGLVGKYEGLFGEPPVVINSFWDVNTSGQTDSSGGTGKTTPEMMAEETFVGWGCNGAWTINDQNDYPRLAWENKPGELITNPSTFWQGNGTTADPYLIYTPQEFNIIGLVPCAWDKCFKLMADIDMSGIAPAQYNSIGKGIGFEFTGTFDGNNHLISNFSCGNTNERSIGMFGFVRGDANIMNLVLFEPNVDSGDNSPVGALVGFLVSGNIDNCSVINGYVRGISEVGGLVGEIDNFLEYATISNCYTTCSVEGTGYRIGGLVGVIDNGAVSRSFSTASVTGQGSIGGLVGRNEGTISNSYATGSVTATDRYGGGLAGRNRTTIGGEGYISNSYSTGRVTGSSSGGFVAISSIPTSNCFWDKETSGKSSSDGGATGLMTEQMQTESTFTDAGWDFLGETTNGTEDIWKIRQGQDYPRLSWEKYGGSGTGEPNNPYLIYTAEQMNAIGTDSNDWDKHFKLVADIDLSEFTGTEFNIIGNDVNSFSGVFNGNNHTIYNFSYQSTGTNAIGLFGSAVGNNTLIKDLTLRDPNVEAGTGVGIGSLVGYLGNGTVTNCYVEGGSVSGELMVGSLVGVNFDGMVENCYVACMVSGNSDFVGGLVGSNYLGTVENCHATCTVIAEFLGGAGGLVGGNSGTIKYCSSDGEVTGKSTIGGLAGNNITNLDGGFGKIENCYSTANVTATDRIAGGLVGFNRTEISNCCSLGAVNANLFVGGLVGAVLEGSIENCYAVGEVVGDVDVGGLVGAVYDSNSSFVQSFWNNTVNPLLTGIGSGVNPNVIGDSTANMQTESTFTDAGWDFTSPVWKMNCESMSYPKLAWWQPVKGDFFCPDGVDFIDYSFFTSHWAEDNCGASNDCDGRDLDLLGSVDIKDLRIFVDNWLAGF